MKNAKPICSSMVEKFDANYSGSKHYKAMTHVLAKNAVNTVAYVQNSTEYTDAKFSIDLPTMTVTNQKSSGRCWLFAGLNVLREIIGKKHNLENFEFSQNYMAFWDKFEKINYFLESTIDLADRPVDDRYVDYVLRTGIQDGGQWDMMVSLIKKYGLVPQAAMNETFQSSNTRAMNGLINQKLRLDAAALREMVAKKQSITATEAEKTRMLDEMYRFLCMNFGQPPKSFQFEFVDKDKKYHCAKNITPIQFYKEYVGDILDEYVSIINAPTADKPFNHTYTVDYLGNVVGGNEILYLNLEINAFKQLVIAQLKDQEVVWFGSDCGKDGEREIGVWDDSAYDYATAFDMDFSMNKEVALDYRHSAMNHAMVITGVNLTECGCASKWKIQNSWGDTAGRKGYFLMTDTWFDKWVYQAVVNRKYLSAEQKNILKKEAKHLNPWDPMGSLAE